MRFTLKLDHEDIEIRFPDFDEEDWRLLGDFLEYSDEAHRTRFMHELNSYQSSFHLRPDGHVRNAGVVPDDEALKSFLHLYRPIILKREPTSFINVRSLLARAIDHPHFRRSLKAWRAQFDGNVLRELCSLKHDELILTAESFLNLYLNAYEYHRDADKRERLSGFAAAFDPDARKALLVLLLKLKITAVSSLRSIVRQLTQHRCRAANPQLS